MGKAGIIGQKIAATLASTGCCSHFLHPAEAVHAKIKKAAFEAGLICYPMGGCIDGKHGDHVLLAPPFILEDAQLDEITGKLATALTEALSVT